MSYLVLSTHSCSHLQKLFLAVNVLNIKFTLKLPKYVTVIIKT